MVVYWLKKDLGTPGTPSLFCSLLREKVLPETVKNRRNSNRLLPFRRLHLRRIRTRLLL